MTIRPHSARLVMKTLDNRRLNEHQIGPISASSELNVIAATGRINVSDLELRTRLNFFIQFLQRTDALNVD